MAKEKLDQTDNGIKFTGVTVNCGNGTLGENGCNALIGLLDAPKDSKESTDMIIINAQEVNYQNQIKEINQLISNNPNIGFKQSSLMFTWTKPSLNVIGTGIATFVLYRKDVVKELEFDQESRKNVRGTVHKGRNPNKGGQINLLKVKTDQNKFNIKTISGHLDSYSLVARNNDWQNLLKKTTFKANNWDDLVAKTPHLQVAGYDANTRNRLEHGQIIPVWNTESISEEVGAIALAPLGTTLISAESTYQKQRNELAKNKREGYSSSGSLDFVAIQNNGITPDGKRSVTKYDKAAILIEEVNSTTKDHKAVVSPSTTLKDINSFDKVRNFILAQLGHLKELGELVKEIEGLEESVANQQLLLQIHNQFLSPEDGVLIKAIGKGKVDVNGEYKLPDSVSKLAKSYSLMPTNDDATDDLVELQRQIGNYDENKNLLGEVKKRIVGDAEKELYHGNDSYKEHHLEAIHRYQRRINAKPLKLEDETQFFRRAFIEYIVEHQNDTGKSFNELLDLREKNPEKATIGLRKLLGVGGAHLYKLALEEEAYSHEFRDAVLTKSTEFYAGKEWTERPVVIVAGPSGSGKSYAAKKIVEAASVSLTKLDDNNKENEVAGTPLNKMKVTDHDDTKGNYVVSVDGGVARETSQIRKLVIQFANNQGYSGIKDLHSKSSILGKIKSNIQEVVFKSPKLGIVMPETFSKWINPFDKIHKLLPRILKLDNTKLIFSRIEGTDAKKFQNVVAAQGHRRAWQIIGNNIRRKLNLNQSGLAESKAYGVGGFKPGDYGSRKAEKWCDKKANSEKIIKLIIKHDLRLYKYQPNKAGALEWQEVNKDGPNVQLISERVFANWKRVKTPDLLTYNAQNKESIILSDSQIALEIALAKLSDCIKSFSEKRSDLALRLSMIRLSITHPTLTNEINPLNRGNIPELRFQIDLGKKYVTPNGPIWRILTELQTALDRIMTTLPPAPRLSTSTSEVGQKAPLLSQVKQTPKKSLSSLSEGEQAPSSSSKSFKNKYKNTLDLLGKGLELSKTLEELNEESLTDDESVDPQSSTKPRRPSN